jgi:hypothetical protein
MGCCANDDGGGGGGDDDDDDWSLLYARVWAQSVSVTPHINISPPPPVQDIKCFCFSTVQEHWKTCWWRLVKFFGRIFFYFQTVKKILTYGFLDVKMYRLDTV